MSAMGEARREHRDELAEAGGVLDQGMAAYVAGHITPALKAAGWDPEPAGDADGEGWSIAFQIDGTLVVVTVLAVAVPEGDGDGS